MKPLLVLHGVEAVYGSAKALFGVDLRVDEGQVVALMGRNGMGKSTTILAIMRMLPLTGGSIFLSGRDMAGLSPHRAARAGLGLVPEGRRCFAPLTVAENLSVAARPGDWTLQRALDLFPRLGERMGQAAQTLSGGEQQMLAIARALLTNPRLLLLDEATEGLAPIVRQEIWAAIRALKEQGMSLLLVDKSLAELRAIADRAVILERGASAWSGRMTRLDDATAHRFLGV